MAAVANSTRTDLLGKVANTFIAMVRSQAVSSKERVLNKLPDRRPKHALYKTNIESAFVYCYCNAFKIVKKSKFVDSKLAFSLWTRQNSASPQRYSEFSECWIIVILCHHF